jgi:hypothetical protein
MKVRTEALSRGNSDEQGPNRPQASPAEPAAEEVSYMAGMSRMPRSRGAFSGVLLILLGAWGGLIPLVGPYFHYAYTPNTTWHFTLARLWLEILPGGAVVLGGLLVTLSASRLIAGAGAILAALGGGWFIVGGEVNRLWPHIGVPGAPAGISVTRVVLEELGFFTGLGAVIVFFAALALGRCSVAVSQDAGAAADIGGYPMGAGADPDATSSFPVGAGADPNATIGFPASTEVSPASSVRFHDDTADPPGGPGEPSPGGYRPTA